LSSSPSSTTAAATATVNRQPLSIINNSNSNNNSHRTIEPANHQPRTINHQTSAINANQGFKLEKHGKQKTFSQRAEGWMELPLNRYGSLGCEDGGTGDD
jgi:hypothetical protein